MNEDSAGARDEWRVEVEIGEDAGVSLASQLSTETLGDAGHDRAVVTRDGNHLFAYTVDEASAHAAEAAIRRLLAAEGAEATVTLTRWHPVEEAWKDAAEPLPATPEDEAAERARHEAAEVAEEAASGEADWEVAVHLETIGDMLELDRKLRDEGLHVSRRWKYLLVGAPTEERAAELAEHLREIAPEGSEVEVIVNPDDLPNPAFVAIGALASRLRDRL